MRFQRKTFSCEALRRNLMRGVAFRQLVIKKRRDFQSSPETYALSVHSGLVGARVRLLSPYKEHLSQAFARYFMRVGLPRPLKDE